MSIPLIRHQEDEAAVRQGSIFVARLASALLDARLVIEHIEDPQAPLSGTIADQITLGLRDWLYRCNAEHLHHFKHLGLVWTDDLTACGHHDMHWSLMYRHLPLLAPAGTYDPRRPRPSVIDEVFGPIGGKPHKPVAGFCLGAPVYDIGFSGAVVGKLTLKLGELVGMETAWRVLAALQCGLGLLNIAATPLWMSQIAGCGLFDDSDPEAAKNDILTPDRLLRSFPEAARRPFTVGDVVQLQRAQASIHKTLAKRPTLALRWASGIVDVAVVLAEVMEPVLHAPADLLPPIDRSPALADIRMNDVNFFSNGLSLLPCVVRWSTTDQIARAYDVVLEHIGRGSNYGEAQLIVGFDPDLDADQPGSMLSAIERIDRAVHILSLSQRLLSSLDEPDGEEGSWPGGQKPADFEPADPNARMTLPGSWMQVAGQQWERALQRGEQPTREDMQRIIMRVFGEAMQRPEGLDLHQLEQARAFLPEGFFEGLIFDFETGRVRGVVAPGFLDGDGDDDAAEDGEAE